MKRIIINMLILAILALPLGGCGETAIIKGYEYETYGLLNRGNNMNPNIEYKVIIGNVIWSVLLFETIIAPIYFLGFSLFEPVGEANKDIKHKGGRKIL